MNCRTLLLLTCVASFLIAGCEPDTTSPPAQPPAKVETAPAKPPVKDEVVPPPAGPARRKAEIAALALSIASSIGALNHCREQKLYVSPTLEDTYYRMRGIMGRLAKTGEEGATLASIAYGAYVRSFKEGKLFTITVPVINNPDDGFAVQELAITTEAQCKALEKSLDVHRQSGGFLDTKPDRSGLTPERDARL